MGEREYCRRVFRARFSQKYLTAGKGRILVPDEPISPYDEEVEVSEPRRASRGQTAVLFVQLGQLRGRRQR